MTNYPNFSMESLPRPPPPSHVPARQPQQQPADHPNALSTTADVGLLSEQSQRPGTSPSNHLRDRPSGPVSTPTQANNSTPTQASNQGPTQAHPRAATPPSIFTRGLRATRRFLSSRWTSLAIGSCFVITLGVAGVWVWYLVQLDVEGKKRWDSRFEGSVGGGDGGGR